MHDIQTIWNLLLMRVQLHLLLTFPIHTSCSESTLLNLYDGLNKTHVLFVLKVSKLAHSFFFIKIAAETRPYIFSAYIISLHPSFNFIHLEPFTAQHLTLTLNLELSNIFAPYIKF